MGVSLSKKHESALPAREVNERALWRRLARMVAEWRATGVKPEEAWHVWEVACAFHDEYYWRKDTAKIMLAKVLCPTCGQPAHDEPDNEPAAA